MRESMELYIIFIQIKCHFGEILSEIGIIEPFCFILFLACV